MRDPEYYSYNNPNFDAPRPQVRHGVLHEGHDGVWLHSASQTPEFVIAQMLAQDPELEVTDLGEVPDTYVSPSQILDSGLEKEIFTPNAQKPPSSNLNNG